ncbi:hypothetical protein ACQEUU_37700 [Nonomuraea sp. CA-218870]|uniref:hypothetical protein n=1 Tax=Nonomuraea sp. CA-218870 TaxID=3239998 RepID=UPI003D8E1B47
MLAAVPITDTTGSPRWEPVRVVAHLAEPVIGLDACPPHLDGPLSWSAYQQHVAEHGHYALPPMGRDSVADFALPLATWTAPAPGGVHPLALASPGLVWGWACSAAVFDGQHTVVEVRRKPDGEAMTRFSPDRKVHLSAGPQKARNAVHAGVLAREVSWWALADVEALTALLGRVRGLGRLTRHGNGRVLRWEVVRDEEAVTRWRDRVWPDPDGVPKAIRAPYHHPSREMPCRG